MSPIPAPYWGARAFSATPGALIRASLSPFIDASVGAVITGDIFAPVFEAALPSSHVISFVNEEGEGEVVHFFRSPPPFLSPETPSGPGRFHRNIFERAGLDATFTKFVEEDE
ncbi:hypothetical protein CEXT_443891 [Caerostris extrusa]|uniref:Uncharacterized protein n=1 Tax=Caerostris extrusa TaxID=172846 RepID=A0AAV4N546_CAEEX|nr:hypothetical protein CEXT_443891 [Caerostris extrusa]